MGAKSMVKEEIRFINNPLTVKQMAIQINNAADAYISLKLTEKELRDLLFHYARTHGKKLFGINGEINPTISKVIGKKRKELVRILLAGCQISML